VGWKERIKPISCSSGNCYFTTGSDAVACWVDSTLGFRTGNEYIPVQSISPVQGRAWTGLDWWTGTIFYVHLCCCRFVVCMPARCDYRTTMAPFSMMILRRVHVHTRTSLTYVCCIQDTCADLLTKASPSVRRMDWTDGLDWCFGLQSGLVTTSPVIRNPTQHSAARHHPEQTRGEIGVDVLECPRKQES